MKISKAHTEKTQPSGEAKSKSGKRGRQVSGERFAKILESKRREAMPPLDVFAQPQHPELSKAASENKTEHVSYTPAKPPEIEQLASEIVERISVHRTGGAPVIDIQFNAKTLAGLQVQVRSDQGAVAVNFLAPAPRIAKLLDNNLGKLRSALEEKGVRLAKIAVIRP